MRAPRLRAILNKSSGDPSFEKARALALAARNADKLNLLDANRVMTALSLLNEFEREHRP